MAAGHCIDRDGFGHWVSGLTDGEGCFQLGWNINRRRNGCKSARCKFRIGLRSDDRPILEEIRAFFGVGRLHDSPNRGKKRPTSHFTVDIASDLVGVIIPHFEQYPLRAKKRLDFAIWRLGVEIVARVNARHREKKKRTRYFETTWTVAERADFGALIAALVQQRRFQAPVVPSPRMSPPPTSMQATLF